MPVGGLAYALFGRVPRPGEATEVDGFRMVVEQMVRRRIKRVHIERLVPVQPNEDELAYEEDA